MTIGAGPDPFGWLAAHAEARIGAGLRRTLRPRTSADSGLLDLAGNDYLGLSRDSEVIEALAAAAKEWGAGSTGSRLVSGSTAVHQELESAAAAHLGTEAALAFSSGYLANLGTVTALTGPGALIVSDARNHASLVDACRLSRARVAIVPHADVDAVERALAGRTEQRAIVVTDGVFSVDGEIAPVADLAAVAQRHGAGLVVDEAHALGVVSEGGRGSVYAAGLAGAPGIVITTVLSKSLGGQGGLVAGPAEVIAHLIDTARTFIFDTGLTPGSAAAGLAALGRLRARPELADQVRRRASELSEIARSLGLDSPRPNGAVCSIRIGAPEAAVAAAETCAAAGVRVGCFRPPSVPDGVSRLRVAARADLRDEDVELARAAFAAVAQQLGRSPAMPS